MSPEHFKQTTWSLDDLLAKTSGAELDQALEHLEDLVSKIEAWRERLASDIDTRSFQDLIQLYELIVENQNRFGYYAGLWFSADTQSQEALGFMGRIEQLSAEIQNRLLFFELWWKGLDDVNAARLLDASGDWRYFLDLLRRFKPHTLSESEEKVINLKNITGISGLTTVYDMITNKYAFELEVDGKVKKMTRAELSSSFRSPSAQVREAAYHELNRVYAQDGNLLGQIFIYCARDWRNENLALRRFASPITVRNMRNDIPDPVVDALLEVCRQNASIFQDYFRLKAKWLDVDKLRRFDIYAPITASNKVFPYGQAVEMVLDSFEAFAPVIAQHARRVFAEGHIDSEIRPGKDGGAFCASPFPGVAPWVHVNYNDQVDDVLTLAHELGHAVHALMAQEHSVLTFHSSLPLAETASVFGEMLLTERLLQEESDPTVRRSILAKSVDDAFATVLRQAYFVLFERQAHAMIAKGKTVDELCDAYMANLQEQFGESLEIDQGFRYEWVAIPHIYQTPFYCYAYSFGQLLVLALYQQYKEEGESFIPRYLELLSHGGSASPEQILTQAGVDITSSTFWQHGFDVIRVMVDQLADF